MGDAADDAINRELGELFWVEEHPGDENDCFEPEDGLGGGPAHIPRTLYKTCSRCGALGLHWRQHDNGKWWLANPNGSWHNCSSARLRKEKTRMHEKYHDSWPDRVNEAHACHLGSLEGRTDVTERPRCRECQMILDVDAERKLLLAVAEMAEEVTSKVSKAMAPYSGDALPNLAAAVQAWKESKP